MINYISNFGNEQPKIVGGKFVTNTCDRPWKNVDHTY